MATDTATSTLADQFNSLLPELRHKILTSPIDDEPGHSTFISYLCGALYKTSRDSSIEMARRQDLTLGQRNNGNFTRFGYNTAHNVLIKVLYGHYHAPTHSYFIPTPHCNRLIFRKPAVAVWKHDNFPTFLRQSNGGPLRNGDYDDLWLPKPFIDHTTGEPVPQYIFNGEENYHINWLLYSGADHMWYLSCRWKYPDGNVPYDQLPRSKEDRSELMTTWWTELAEEREIIEIL